MTVPAPAKRLLDFIASYEAPRGYDTVYGNKMSRMPKPITTMTVDEVIAQGKWRTENFGSSACGRYQFMKATLAGLKASQRLTGSERMTPDLQDRLGYALLLARGYRDFMAGQTSTAVFGNEIAKEWASFPVLAPTNGKRRGQSYYAGDGLNHVLVGPEPVEAVLRAMRADPAVSVAPAPAVVAPQAETVPAKAAVPWWQRWFAPKSAAAKARPGLHPNGDPALWDLQAGMRDRGYYNDGLLDGLEGGKTQKSVAQIRKDNGLGDGGIDAAFLAAFPSLPSAAVSKERAQAGLMKARASDPAAFNPAIWLATTGLSTLGLGGASAGGAFDQVTSTIDKISSVAGQVQGGLSTVSSVVLFLVEHKTLVLLGIGAFFTIRGLAWLARLWVDFRLGRR